MQGLNNKTPGPWGWSGCLTLCVRREGKSPAYDRPRGDNANWSVCSVLNMPQKRKNENDKYVIYRVCYLRHGGARHFPCIFRGMTRVTSASGAELAHYFHARDRHLSRTVRESKNSESTDTRRAYGNRRMGDRREGERRRGGRRAADRMNAHETSSWCTTELTAHLIGQWLEPTPVSAQQAKKIYGAVAALSVKRGEVV